LFFPSKTAAALSGQGPVSAAYVLPDDIIAACRTSISAYGFIGGQTAFLSASQHNKNRMNKPFST